MRLVSTPSFTGSEEACAAVLEDELREPRLQVQWQQVEDGRANVLGTWAGAGGGPTLMFNGHLDTSYSGREPWLAGIPGFQPEGFERDGRIYGLGISNMKGALACYVEAVRALRGRRRLRGDVMIAAVCGEIEKTQQGDAQGAEFRGYAAGSRYLVGHGGAADMCILGEPTENKLVLAHFGALWLRLTACTAVHPHGLLVRAARGELDRAHARRARSRARVAAAWEEEMSYGDVRGVANVGAIQGGFGWRASRTPHATDLFLDLRVPPDVPMAEARRQALELARGLGGRRGRGLRDGAGRRDRRGAPARRRASTRARGGLRRGCPSATSRAGSPTPRCSPATGSRRSTTARRAGCRTPSSARTSRSTGSSRRPRSTRRAMAVCGSWDVAGRRSSAARLLRRRARSTGRLAVAAGLAGTPPAGRGASVAARRRCCAAAAARAPACAASGALGGDADVGEGARPDRGRSAFAGGSVGSA